MHSRKWKVLFSMLAAVIVAGIGGISSATDIGSIPGVLPYSGTAIVPPGFLPMVDSATNPQWMIFIRKQPYENGGNAYSYSAMTSFTPNDPNEIIPSTELGDLIISQTGVTWVVTGGDGMLDLGNWPDWLSGAIADEAGNYHLMTVVGYPYEDSDNSGIYFTPQTTMDFNGNIAHIRTVYSTWYVDPLTTHLERCGNHYEDLGIPQSECNALAYLYSETDGTNWTAHDGWFTSTDLGSRMGGRGGHDSSAMWTGGGHIIQLNLGENNLHGSIMTGLVGLPYLQQTTLSNNSISSVNTSGLTELTTFNMGANGGGLSLDFSYTTGLHQVTVSYDGLGDEAIADLLAPLVNLTEVHVDGNPITTLSFPNNPNLTYITASYSESLENMDISNNTGITYLEANETSLTSLDTHNNPSISEIHLHNTSLSSLDVSSLSLLTVLDLQGDYITGIDLSHNPLLQDLSLNRQHTVIYSLDISHNTSLQSVSAEGNTIQSLTVGNPDDYSDSYDRYSFSYNALCESTPANTVAFLNRYNEGWESRQFCPGKNVAATAGDKTIQATWETPSDYGMLGQLIDYQLSWIPDGGEALSLDTATHSHTIEGLTNGVTYTLTFCPNYGNEGPNVLPCTTLTATPHAATTSAGFAGGGGGSSSSYTPPPSTNTGSTTGGTTGGSSSGATGTTSNLYPTSYLPIYTWAQQNGLTTLSMNKARLDDQIQRYEAAKMLVNYVVNVEKKTITHNPLCIITNYSDYRIYDAEMRGYIQKICDLGLMGWNNPKTAGILPAFRPFDYLKLDEFNIIIDRYLGDITHGAATSNKRIDILKFLMNSSVK